MDVSYETLVMRLLEQALELPPDQRAAWLSGQTGDDSVRDRVLMLLAAEAGHTAFLETPAGAGVLAVVGLPQPGDRLGAWELLRQIDAGGMGVVYLARRADRSYEQQVAIKLLRTDYLLADPGRTQELVARFENERRLLARLDHANIARILDGGTGPGGAPYLVMEYIDGPPLTEYCDRNGLTVRQRLAIFTKVCDGVQIAHRNLIVHRDLKPGNVLVGSDGEPRLLDFGIARPLADDSGNALTQTATLAMTPAYASPEQVRNEPLTTASDVYSLGVMLYELLAGTRPYTLVGLSPVQSERIVCEVAPETLRGSLAKAALAEPERRARLTGIGSDIERIVAKAMHKDPARRYDTAQALADDLHRYLGGRPVQAHPDSAGYRLGKFLRRNRLGVSIATIALVAIVCAATVALWQARQARRAAADTEQVNEFLIKVMGSSDAYGAGAELTLNEAIAEAATHIDTQFASRPDLAAGLRLAIGTSLTNRARFDVAEAQLQRGLDEAEATLGDDHELYFRLRSAIAMLRSYQGRYQEALAFAEESLRLAEAAGFGRQPLYATLISDIAYIHLTNDAWEAALPYAQRAVDAFERDEVDVPPASQAAMLSNLAQALDENGDPDGAIASYRRALAILETLFPEGSPDNAITLNNLGLLYRTLGDNERALALLQASADMRRRLLKPGHPLIVRGFTNAARMALVVGQVEHALDNARIAVSTGEQAFPDPHLHQALALTALAEAQLRQGDATVADATLARAEAILAQLPENTESGFNYVADIRRQVCAASADAAGCASR